MSKRGRKKSTPPMPKWVAEKDIKFERRRTRRDGRIKNQIEVYNPSIIQASDSKIDVIFVEKKCSCQGENENCFKCHGTGFTKARVLLNPDECKDVIQQRVVYGGKSKLENSFSNDARGGIYGIRERGRFISNPDFEEDH